MQSHYFVYTSIQFKDIEDRDFTPETTSLALRWTGFIHPHQHVNYSACIGTVPSTCDTSAMKTLETYNSYTFKGLNLQPFQVPSSLLISCKYMFYQLCCSNFIDKKRNSNYLSTVCFLYLNSKKYENMSLIKCK